MTIHFDHDSRKFHARVLFDFKQIGNVIALDFDEPVYGECYNLLLYYDFNTHNWKNFEENSKLTSQLFDTILYKLRGITKVFDETLYYDYKNKKNY